MTRLLPSIAEIVVLSVWLGEAVFFSAAVAPALFAVLPTRTLAGAVVGRLLPIVFYAGMVAGAALLALQWIIHRRWTFGGRELSGIMMIVSCAIAQFIVSPRRMCIQEEIGGPLEALSADDPRRAAFGRLHGISVAWLGLAMLAAVVALVIAWRSIDNEAHP